MKKKYVHIKVDNKFFKNIFEKERKNMELKLGKRLTQGTFTEILAKSNSKIITPKIKSMDKNKFIKKNIKPISRGKRFLI